ncbi:protein of unknown function [Methylorubrum extorquens DM4]|uniref:Uncharacterized protein n=1 Tax=Methylorubrum extorquens (strain DSM 6343 / CIP 106787 / DM4) TaxID=661410 RepID=C7C989_METED|nr:hypothetical protein [Methylorubrum extorquens]CAX22055.1 protein of unknown function [Methylorubrum extorquens DM4]
MRTTHSRILNAFGGGSSVVEHVYLDDVIEAWDAAMTRAGIDPTLPASVAALRDLLDKAGILTLSTWGMVYKAEHARADLANALAAFGVDPPAESPIEAPPEDRILH